MGWYIPFHKFNRLDTELDKWEYLIQGIAKIRWLCGIYILSMVCSLCWILTHPHIYKSFALKISCVFLGGLLGSLIIFFILPLVIEVALILIWIVLNICSILHKLFKYIGN